MTTTKTIPTESTLRMLLASGMAEHVQNMLDIHPELKYKIEDGELVDSVTGAELWLKQFVTQDTDCIAMKKDALKLSAIDDEVLITGESGTGKEFIARSLIGDRPGAFKRINCAAMPENLIEAELFGSVKGAYTGSTTDKDGMIFSANRGVMFLDEIGDLPLSIQAKLLNVLQPVDGKRYVRPIGSTEEKQITCRFVCATHRNLLDMVDKGLFRLDLYARISTFELNIKSLAKRKGDIPLIVEALGHRFKIPAKAKEFIERYQEDITNDKIDLSLNVRSIERALKRYDILGRV